jgi:hypothetical protein
MPWILPSTDDKDSKRSAQRQSIWLVTRSTPCHANYESHISARPNYMLAFGGQPPTATMSRVMFLQHSAESFWPPGTKRMDFRKILQYANAHCRLGSALTLVCLGLLRETS